MKTAMVTEKKLLLQGNYKLFDANGDLSKRWFIYRTENGQRKKEYGLLNRIKNAPDRYAEAKRLAASLVLPDNAPKSIMRLIEEFLVKPGTKKRESTLKAYKAAFNHFSAWATAKNIDAHNFTPELAQEYIAATNAAYAQAVRGLFAMAVKKGVIAESPFAGVSRDYEHDPAPRFTEEHRIAVLEWLRTQRYDVYIQSKIMFYCFIRGKEQIRLKKTAIDWETGTIYVHSEAAKCAKRPRRVVIPEPLIPELRQYIDSLGTQDWLFATKKGKQHTRIEYFNRWIERACIALGITIKYSTYSFRHSSAIKAVMKGISVRQLQMQMGHASLDMTGRYLRQMGWQDMDEMRGGW